MQKGKGKSLDIIFWRIPPINTEEIPTQVEQNETNINKKYVALKFDQEEIRKLWETDPYYPKLIEKIKQRNEGSKEDSSLDPHSAIYKKIKDHRKEFGVLIVPNTFQKYILCESHNSPGHNGTTRVYQFLKRQYYWKGLKESVQKIVTLSAMSNNKSADTYLCTTSSRNTPDKSGCTVVKAYLKELYCWFRESQMILSDNGSEFKNSLFLEVVTQLGINTHFDPIQTLSKWMHRSFTQIFWKLHKKMQYEGRSWVGWSSKHSMCDL